MFFPFFPFLTSSAGKKLFAWGSNSSGALGDGSTTARSSPVQIGALTTWSLIAGAKGSSNGAAIKTDGTLWIWGSGNNGIMGDGTTAAKSSPIQVGALTTWARIALGAYSAHAIKTDGTLWVWGNNASGQFGDSSVNNKSSPIQIGALTTWSKIAAGGVGHILAITTSGTLWASGANSDGRLGDGSTTDRSSPVQVGALTTWAEVSCGNYHSIARKTDGTIWTWGQNYNSGTYQGGYLGINTAGPGNKSSPVQIGALTTWATIAAGGRHGLGVKTDGTLWAWGNNASGQLGDGSTTLRSSPVQIGALTTWAAVSAGRDHSIGLKTDGTIWAWGSNGSGRLGDGSTTGRSSPVQIGALTTWSAIAGGYARTFALQS